MPIDTQSKLLRVLQDQEVRPVGGKTSYKTNCRIIAATNRKPEDAIKDGKLREDLFYRISAHFRLSAAVARTARRHHAAGEFISETIRRAGQPRRCAASRRDAVERLTTFEWPGNIRQLQNEIQRAVLLSEGDEVNVTDLSISDVKFEREPNGHDTSFTLLEGVERNAIIQMLKETGGNKLETAKRLGIGRQTLYNKIKAYGIET